MGGKLTASRSHGATQVQAQEDSQRAPDSSSSSYALASEKIDG